MRKLLFFLLFLIILFTYAGSNFSKKAMAADMVGPGNLSASASCSPNSTITFQWSDPNNTPGGPGHNIYFWRTGYGGETQINNGDYNQGDPYNYKLIQSSLPANTTYDWYIKFQSTTPLCIGSCTIQVDGPRVTSRNCDITLPTCNYTYTDWSQCSETTGLETRTVLTKTPNPCTGDPVLTQGCTPVTDRYDCAHRSPGCPTSTYQNCKDWPFSYLGSCYPPYCAMSNTQGSDQNTWTHSCAWKNGDNPPADYVPPAEQVQINYTPIPPPCNDGDNHTVNCASVKTAFGDISTSPEGFISKVLAIVLSLSGGILLLLLILAGYRLMTSQGDPEKVKEARERVTSAIIGIFFIIFSFVAYQFITSNVLSLPGFK